MTEGSEPSVAVPAPRRRRGAGWRNPVLGLLAVLGVIVGVALVVTGNEEAARPGPSTTAPRDTTRPTLPLGEGTLSQARVAELARLELPEGTADFLSAQLDDRRQLDVTFTIPVEGEAAFVAGSGLPPLTEGSRVVTHASPLWELNPGGTIRGTSDVSGRVRRAVELVPEGDRLRARVVVTPA